MQTHILVLTHMKVSARTHAHMHAHARTQMRAHAHDNIILLPREYLKSFNITLNFTSKK